MGIQPLAVSAIAAGRLLGVARCTVYKLMDRGELDFFYVGVARRIKVSDVETYMERNSVRHRGRRHVA